MIISTKNLYLLELKNIESIENTGNDIIYHCSDNSLYIFGRKNSNYEFTDVLSESHYEHMSCISRKGAWVVVNTRPAFHYERFVEKKRLKEVLKEINKTADISNYIMDTQQKVKIKK